MAQALARRKPSPPRRRQLGIECFESRALLAQVVLNPSADNTIFSEATSNSDGAGQFLYSGPTFVGVRRALLKFDVAGAVPKGAHIDNVTLQLHVSRIHTTSEFNYEVHKVVANWGEGASDGGNPGGRGAPATTNDATWHFRLFSSSTWSTDGGDFASSASANASVGDIGFVQWTGPLLAADVQSWLNTPTGQFGWLIKATDESAGGNAKRFDSRENSDFAPTLTINYTGGATNAPPTIDAIANATIGEDAGQQAVNLTGISAGPGETQALSLTASSDNPTLIVNTTFNYTSPNATGTLNYVPAANQNGTANITVTVRDTGLNGIPGDSDDGTFSRSFSVTVNPVNDAPGRTSGAPSPINANEDSANTAAVSLDLGTLSYGPGGGTDEASQTLTYKVTAIPSFLAVTLLDGTTPVTPGGALSLTQLQGLKYKTLADANGTGNLMWTVQDNGGTAGGGLDTLTESLAITIAPVNDRPVRTTASPPAISVNEDSAQTAAVTLGLGAISYSPGGGSGESSQTLTFRLATIPSLVTLALIDGTTPVIAGTPLTLAQFQGLKYKTVADASGSGNLVWTIQDSGGTANGGLDTLAESLSITVASVNDPPTLDAIADPTAIPLNSGLQTIILTGITAGPLETGQTVSIVTHSSNQALIPDPTVHYSNPAATGSLTYTPATDQSGTAVITVTVTDSGGTASGGVNSLVRTFTVLVNSADFVNQAPSFVKGSNQSPKDFAGAVSVPGWAGSISPGPPSEAAQTVSFIVTNDSHGLFAVQPDVTSAGTLTFTPLPNAHGTAVVTVQAQDNGGTANGGVDKSATQTFTIEIDKPHRWHNTLHALDVDNDNKVLPKDALSIINYLNTFGPGAVPTNPLFGPPYLDAVGNDAIAPNDALAVINFLNSFGPGGTGPAGEGEGSATSLANDFYFQQLGATMQPVTATSADFVAMLLTGADGSVPRPKRRA